MNLHLNNHWTSPCHHFIILGIDYGYWGEKHFLEFTVLNFGIGVKYYPKRHMGDTQWSPEIFKKMHNARPSIPINMLKTLDPQSKEG